MKKLLSAVYPLCALVALGWFIYKAYPIFPYVNDRSMVLPAVAFLLFLFLAYKTNGMDNAHAGTEE